MGRLPVKWLAALGAALLCLLAWRRHVAVKHPLGGYRCKFCGKPGESFEDFGAPGYVNPLRKTFDRDGKSITRSNWDAA